MRPFTLLFLALVGLGTNAVAITKTRPHVSTSEAAQHVGVAATVYGKVTEIRWIAGGPLIFELDGKPSAPRFRALVYPMAIVRFGADPQTVYLGKEVEVTGLLVSRRDLPQVWINDPAHIRLAPERNGREAQAAPAGTAQ